MPLPLILAGIGAAAAGAYAYSKLKDSDDDDVHIDQKSLSISKIKKAHLKLNNELQPLEQATQRLNDACMDAANDSKLVVGGVSFSKRGEMLPAGSLAIEYANQKFQKLLQDKPLYYYDIKKSAKAFRLNIASQTQIIARAATTMDDLLARYRKDRELNQHLVGAIRLMMTYNQALMMVPLFDPTDQMSSVKFKFNSKFSSLTQDIKAGLDGIKELIDIKVSESERQIALQSLPAKSAKKSYDLGADCIKCFCYDDASQLDINYDNKAHLPFELFQVRLDTVPSLCKVAQEMRTTGTLLECLYNLSFDTAKKHAALMENMVFGKSGPVKSLSRQTLDVEYCINDLVDRLNYIIGAVYKNKARSRYGVLLGIRDRSSASVALSELQYYLEQHVPIIDQAVIALNQAVKLFNVDSNNHKSLVQPISRMLKLVLNDSNIFFNPPLCLLSEFEPFDPKDVEFASIKFSLNPMFDGFVQELKSCIDELNECFRRLGISPVGDKKRKKR